MKKRIFALLLLLPLLITLIVPANAAYENTHKNTGDQRKDIIAVAKTQLGYKEGSNNYTKYGVWYGQPNSAWCGMFVAWCANQAGVPTSVLRKYARANPSGYGLSALDGRNYRPQAGDLFFKRGYTHTGLVYYVEGDYFYTLEGNAGSGSNKVVSQKRKISDYIFGSPNYRGGAEHSYEVGYDTKHPHKEYKYCTHCSDKFYTGNTSTSSSCSTCIQANCSHSYGNWTKSSDSKHVHTCTKCGKQETGSHSWNSGKVIKAATCAESGIKEQSCTACGATRTVTIQKTEDHKFDEWTYMDEQNHRRVCSVCKKQEIVNHDDLTAWTTDANSHWLSCATCAQEKISFGIHDFNNNCETPCLICQYLQPGGHSYHDAWTTDELGHWHTCDYCQEKGEYAEHVYTTDCDEDCEICGYVRKAPVQHNMQQQIDDLNHWEECQSCHKQTGKSTHTPGPAATEEAPQLCTHCGYELAPVLPHTHKYNYTTDRGSHWGECYCGHVMGPEAHVWDMSSGKCAYCGTSAMAMEEPVNYDYVWVILAAVAFFGMVTPIAAAISKKKKERELYA